MLKMNEGKIYYSQTQYLVEPTESVPTESLTNSSDISPVSIHETIPIIRKLTQQPIAFYLTGLDYGSGNPARFTLTINHEQNQDLLQRQCTCY